MPVLTVRCDKASLDDLGKRAVAAGYKNVSDYARARLGLQTTGRRKMAREPRLRLRLTDAQQLALSRATGEAGYANRSAYVRARLFLSDPPAAPIVGKADGEATNVSFVLQLGDDARLESAVKRSKRPLPEFVLRKIFGAGSTG